MARIAASRSGRLAIWFAAFLLLAVVEALQLYAGQRFEDFKITWGLALRRGLESWAPCSVLSLGVLWLSERFPFERGRPLRWTALHLGSSCVYVLISFLIHAALLTGQRSVHGEVFEFGTVFRKMLVFYSLNDIGFYWLILLGHQGWRYYQRFRDRERHATELEGQLARAQLDALRMQLNPHFLFNALNTVVALVHEQPHTAERMVTRLGELLRASLDHPDMHEVPLRDELALLERYLDIEQVRFSDRLHVKIRVADDVRDLQVPPFILQPLVENAIRHGIEPMEAEGRIEIEAKRVGEQLQLTVRDNGPGPAPERTGPRSGGIGLANTRSRLKHLYGSAQSLELRRGAGGGGESIALLPVRGTGSNAAGRTALPILSPVANVLLR